MSGFHPLDGVVVLAYFVIVIFVGHRSRRHSKGEENYFLAGRRLGKFYQFFLNFGNSTDVTGAVSTTSLVYQQGVSGVWLSFQMIFLNPYYWFMNTWFRRVRLVTMADLFEDRLGSRWVARFYAVFQTLAATVVILGLGNLVTYKICSAIAVKPESAWTSTERASVDDYRALRRLELAAEAGPLSASDREQLATLRERNDHGELHSYVTAIPPLPFYLIYTLIIGAYIVVGGMSATAVNEVLQSVLIVAFSVLLIPFGLLKIGGFDALSERVPAAMFELVGTGQSHITGTVLLALFLVTLVQINATIGNMGISGSARDEFSARFGSAAGTYAKRLIIILWSFCGLLAIALYSGPDALSDPDAAWGALSRQLLGPGLLGVMMIGALAANMSRVSAETMCLSALFVRNVWRHLRPGLDEAGAVRVGRYTIVVALVAGAFAAMHLGGLFSVVQVLLTLNVPFGACVLLMFLWRRLTLPAVWVALAFGLCGNVLFPLVATRVEALRSAEPLLVRSQADGGRQEPVYFERIVRARGDHAVTGWEGRGRFHVELWALGRLGCRVETWDTSERFAARLFYSAAVPFILLIGVSLITRPPDQRIVEAFYGKMKTPVGRTPQLERLALAETQRDPRRFDHLKLWPRSNWEFTRWDRIDTIGFLACCAASGTIIAAFWWLLRLAAA